MSYLKARFDGYDFKWVEGYAIACVWAPRTGFQGNFYVYVWERTEAQTPFEECPDVGEEGVPQRGTLEMSSDAHNYSFEKIDLVSAQYGVTRLQRYRILTFRYDKAITSEQKTPAKVANKNPKQLQKTSLGDDYKFSLDGGAEHLLGFRNRVSASEANAFRFSALRTKESNSFLEKVIDLSDKTAEAGNKMQPFTVTFKQGDLTVNEENLRRIYVTEGYGLCQSLPVPSLDKIVDPRFREQEAVMLDLEDFSQADLLREDAGHLIHEHFLEPQTVQTATFVFEAKHFRDFKIK